MSIDRSVIKPTAVEGIYIPPELIQAAMDKKGPYVPIQRTCLGCLHFSEFAVANAPAENCAKFGARPPARVIAFGCPSYDNDDVPF